MVLLLEDQDRGVGSINRVLRVHVGDRAHVLLAHGQQRFLRLLLVRCTMSSLQTSPVPTKLSFPVGFVIVLEPNRSRCCPRDFVSRVVGREGTKVIQAVIK